MIKLALSLEQLISLRQSNDALVHEKLRLVKNDQQGKPAGILQQINNYKGENHD